MVWGKSGKSQFFPFEKLDHVLDGERIFVAMFADQGVTIPKDTFVRGDAEQFGAFLKARINKKAPHRDQTQEDEGRKGRCRSKTGRQAPGQQGQAAQAEEEQEEEAVIRPTPKVPRPAPDSESERLKSGAGTADGPILPNSRATSLQT